MTLGREIGRGGEGAVFLVDGDDGVCAKTYHEPPSSERVEKLRLMSGLRTDALAAVATWPIDLLVDGAAVRGFTMPLASASRDVHRLYSPKSRRSDFVRADFRFIVRTASNVARAFATVHGAGCVVGDVNHGSVLVAQDATVRLTDVDSFQVTSGGRTFRCGVGVDTYTPPELQGARFGDVDRTANHDAFGLAVLGFHLLMMGRHPFAGRYLGRGDMPIAKAIEEVRFPYGARAAEVEMTPPPGAPTLEVVGNEVGALFERAFSREGVKGGRPDATEWAVALERLERGLVQCQSNQAHWFREGLSACPWCSLEVAGGTTLFPLVVQGGSGAPAVDLEALWRHVLAVPGPGRVPVVEVPEPRPHVEATRAGRVARAVRGASWGVGLGLGTAIYETHVDALLYLAVPLVWAAIRRYVPAVARPDMARAVGASEALLKPIRRQWGALNGDDFDRIRQELGQVHERAQGLPALRSKRLARLQGDRRGMQLLRYLDRYDLDGATIQGIGEARRATLRSYGIETAGDVTEASVVIPGFGPYLQGQLLGWKGGLERGFAFDPDLAVDPSEVAAVERDVAAQARDCEMRLRNGLLRLQREAESVRQGREMLLPGLTKALTEHAQAVANMRQAKGKQRR